MKILLTQDVDNLGHAGDVKTVADGYGRNFLLPRGLAVLATAGALKSADRMKAAAVARRAKEKADVDAIAQVINGQTLHFTARAGEKGKLFGSITSANIAAELSKKLGSQFDKRKVALREPLREAGSHSVTIKLASDVHPQVTVVITPEGTLVNEPEPAVVTAEIPELEAATAAK
jgi:large subunit ribosomal protein L9